MKKLLNLRTLVGLLLIVIALLPESKPAVDDAILLNIEKPSQEIIELVSPISNIVTDPTDRVKLAIFNQEFGNRVKAYNSDVQQVNDVYVLAASNFFKESLRNKYEQLDVLLVDLLAKACTTDNHTLTQQEKDLLSSYATGLSWALIQKR